MNIHTDDLLRMAMTRDPACMHYAQPDYLLREATEMCTACLSALADGPKMSREVASMTKRNVKRIPYSMAKMSHPRVGYVSIDKVNRSGGPGGEINVYSITDEGRAALAEWRARG